MTPLIPALALARVGPGIYRTADGAVRVPRYQGRSWSASRGSYAYTTWTAALVAKVGTGEPETYEIARAGTLTDLRTRLATYLADAAAGTLGARSRYGFSGDARPVARGS